MLVVEFANELYIGHFRSIFALKFVRAAFYSFFAS